MWKQAGLGAHTLVLPTADSAQVYPSAQTAAPGRTCSAIQPQPPHSCTHCSISASRAKYGVVVGRQKPQAQRVWVVPSQLVGGNPAACVLQASFSPAPPPSLPPPPSLTTSLSLTNLGTGRPDLVQNGRHVAVDICQEVGGVGRRASGSDVARV